MTLCESLERRLFLDANSPFASPMVIDSDPAAWVTTADFDGDGDMDLAVIKDDGNLGMVQVLLNNGQAGFGSPTSYLGTWGEIIAADFNNDGNVDLATANTDGNTVAVLLGRGDGTFQDSVTVLAISQSGIYGAQAQTLSTGDVNGDGNLDLVAGCADNGVGVISVLLGTDAGTFNTPLETRTVSDSFDTLAVGDVNGDGQADVAWTRDGNAMIYLADSEGNLQDAMAALPDSAVAVGIGEVNGGGNAELVVVSEALMESYVTVQVLAYQSDGTFVAVSTQTTMGEGWDYGMRLADVNDDGLDDIIAIVGSEGRSVRVAPADGDGGFQNPMEYSIGWNTICSMAAADFDGDGVLDLVAVPQGDGLVLVRGNGNGAFQAPATIWISGYSGSSAAGDFNGDGVVDMVITSWEEGVVLLTGYGNGAFGAATTIDGTLTAQAGAYLVAEDFDVDGNLDIAFVLRSDEDEGTLTVVLGNGDGTFQDPYTFELGSRYSVGPLLSADLNNDGIPDLLSCREGGAVSILGGENGIFQTPVNLGLGNEVYGLAVGDFDGDGNLDVAATVEGQIAVLLGNGSGTFRSRVDFVTPDYSFSGMAAGDLDNDGRAELAAYTYSGSLLILRSHDDGSLEEVSYYETFADEMLAPILADINNDGNLDVAVLGRGGYSHVVLPGNGDGTFQDPIEFDLNAVGPSAEFVDVDGDGDLDVIMQKDYDQNAMSILLNTTSEGGWPEPLAGDANNDGMVDVGDLGILGANYGVLSDATRRMGDLNGDGMVDVGDLGILGANYGRTLADTITREPVSAMAVADDVPAGYALQAEAPAPEAAPMVSFVADVPPSPANAVAAGSDDIAVASPLVAAPGQTSQTALAEDLLPPSSADAQQTTGSSILGDGLEDALAMMDLVLPLAG